MTHQLQEQIASSFAELQDPCRLINQAHLFIDILVMSICAIVCGADDWEAVADYAEAKEEWLASFLALPGWPPAHDTFWRVFRHLDAEQFQRCFLKWMASMVELKSGQVIALDGKQVRRSHDKDAERIFPDKRQRNVRYYIASFPIQAQQAITMTRHHWHIENRLHWVLDIAFREDECRIRKDNGAQNFAILRHIALNLLKQETTSKLGVKNKRLKAGWDETYLLRVLQPLFS